MAGTDTKTPPSHDSVLNRIPSDKPQTAVVSPAVEAIQPIVAPVVAPVETPDVNSTVEAAKNSSDDLSDEDFLKAYEKRTGKKLKSIEDLKEPAKPLTPEQITEAKKKEETEALDWAFSTDKLKREDYDKAVVAKSKEKRAIALEIFTAEEQAEDKNLTSAECEEKFKDFYCEEEDEDSWKRKKALKAMNAVADNYLAQYKGIDTLTDEYREVKTNAQRHKEFSKEVNAIAKEIPNKLSFSHPTGEEVEGKQVMFDYEVEVDDKVTAQIAKELIATGNAKMWNAKPEVIKAEIEYHVFARNKDKIISDLLAKNTIKVADEVEVRFRNARNPQQQIGGQQPASQPKELPSHASVLERVK